MTSGHLHKTDRWLHSQLASHLVFVSVMARSKKAWPVVGETSKILKAETWSVEKSFSETWEELDWEEHLRPRQKNPHTEHARKRQIPGMVSAWAHKITQPLNSSLVSRQESKGWIVLAEVPPARLACTQEDIPQLHPMWCRQQCLLPVRLTGQSHRPLQPVGYAAVNSYIIVKAAKSSSKRRNCQNKGCQSNFNSTSWRICLLMWSLITSSQSTFSSTRLLLHSGHNGQTTINEGPVNILSCPFFCSVCGPRRYLLHAIKDLLLDRIIHLLLDFSLMYISVATVSFPEKKEFLFQHSCEQRAWVLPTGTCGADMSCRMLLYWRQCGIFQGTHTVPARSPAPPNFTQSCKHSAFL